MFNSGNSGTICVRRDFRHLNLIDNRVIGDETVRYVGLRRNVVVVGVWNCRELISRKIVIIWIQILDDLERVKYGNYRGL